MFGYDRLDILTIESHAREVGASDRCPLGAEMDTSQQTAITPRDRAGSVAAQRQRRSIAEKRRIVEETLEPGASVARVARVHGVNANQVFGWRRLYLAGRLGEQKPGIKLLPVRVSESTSARVVVEHRVTDISQPRATIFAASPRRARKARTSL